MCYINGREYTSKIEKIGGKVLVPKTDVPVNIFLSWSIDIAHKSQRVN